MVKGFSFQAGLSICYPQDMPHRRDFIKLICVLGLETLLPSTVLAFGEPTELPHESDQEIFSKSVGYRVPHDHVLKIPKSAIHNPPAQGVTVQTTPANWLAWWGMVALRHKHEILVSQEQLLELQKGNSITLQDDAQVHSFVFEMKTA